MDNLVQDLLKLTPEQQAVWAAQMAAHQPPPGDFMLAVPKTDTQIMGRPEQTLGPVNPPVSANFGGVVNPPAPVGVQTAGPKAPVAAYTAPTPVGFTPEQTKLLAAQGERTPIPKMPAPSGTGLGNTPSIGQMQTVAPSAQTGRGTVAPRATLAQLLGSK